MQWPPGARRPHYIAKDCTDPAVKSVDTVPSVTRQIISMNTNDGCEGATLTCTRAEDPLGHCCCSAAAFVSVVAGMSAGFRGGDGVSHQQLTEPYADKERNANAPLGVRRPQNL